MQFQTPYNRKSSPPEINSGKSQTEKAGYIPAKIRIENMMLAGQRLVAHRAEMYDFGTGVEPDEDYPIDPTRSKNFDMSDAFVMSEAIKNNVRQRELLKASQTVPDASGEVLNDKKGDNTP